MRVSRLVDAAAKGFAAAGAQGMLRNMLALQKKLYDERAAIALFPGTDRLTLGK